MDSDYNVYELKGFSRRYTVHKKNTETENNDTTPEETVGLDGATRLWLVYFNGETMENRVQASANPPPPTAIPELPAIGSAHPLDSSVKLKSYEITDNKNGTATYKATYEYKIDEVTPPETDQGSDERAGWAPVTYQTQAQFDAEGTPLLLPTNEPLAELPTVAAIGLSFTSIKIYDSIPNDLLEANGTINSNPITVEGYSVGAHCGLLKVRAKPIIQNGNSCWEVLTTIEIRNTLAILMPNDEAINIGHDTALLLAGTQVRPQANKPAMASSLLDEDGRTESIKGARVLLMPNGMRYQPTESTSTEGVPCQAYYKRISVYPESSFDSSWF